MAWTEKYVSVAGGGAHDGTSEANAWTLAEAIAAYAAGQRINVKAGTYANTTTGRTFATAGTTTSPIWWRGYNTTIGDIDTDNTLAKPVISFTTANFYANANYQVFSNLDITSQDTSFNGTLRIGNGIQKIRFHRCRFENTAANSAARAMLDQGNEIIFSACRFKATTTADICAAQDQGPAVYIGCVFHGGVLAWFSSGDVAHFDDCVFEGHTSRGLDALEPGSTVNNCSIYGGSSDGIRITAPGAAFHITIANTLFVNCGGYGVNNSSGTNSFLISLINNGFFNCTSGQTNGITEAFQFGAVSLSADPFTNAAGADFSINGTAGAKAAGLPGAFEGESYTSYLDIGAVQRQESAGGSGGGLKLVGRGGLAG
jgi:hypothetical protein